ncbi:hypothetical protein [Aquitalea sp. ASV11]|uniref:hypothetical protein n=1 Tax=Aquitalea sp. ASV11 TaxID=2795103 RepID=UPI0018EC7D21|nr:hypothetical protein [Aquitalea sp. ASV11]
MNFNRWPTHKVQILKRYFFKFISSIFICSGLNGCDSYSTSLCDNFAKTITYKDNTNNFYIDIAGRENDDNAELHSILVEKVSHKKNSIESNTYYWSLNSLATRQMGSGTINDFPIRYGITLPGTRVETPAQTLNNGNYKILGFAILYKHNKRCNKKLRGEFILTDGKIISIN